jgi:hypothetical protein
MLRGILRGEILFGWHCLEYLSVGEGGKTLHRRVFHGINFPEGVFCGSNFLLGGREGAICGKTFPWRGGDFQHDFINNIEIKVFFK